MALAASQDRWAGFDYRQHTFPVMGKVLLCDVKVILQEWKAGEQPELGLLVTWMRRPGRPFQATQAIAFRSAKSIGALVDPEQVQVFSDHVQISPHLAWGLMQADDPMAWYSALHGGAQDPLPFQPV